MGVRELQCCRLGFEPPPPSLNSRFPVNLDLIEDRAAAEEETSFLHIWSAQRYSYLALQAKAVDAEGE